MQAFFRRYGNRLVLYIRWLYGIGFVADHPVNLLDMAQIVAVKGIEFTAVTQENTLPALGEHHFSQLCLFCGCIGDPPVGRKTAAGEKAQIRVKFPQRPLCEMAHVSRGIV